MPLIAAWTQQKTQDTISNDMRTDQWMSFTLKHREKKIKINHSTLKVVEDNYLLLKSIFYIMTFCQKSIVLTEWGMAGEGDNTLPSKQR